MCATCHQRIKAEIERYAFNMPLQCVNNLGQACHERRRIEIPYERMLDDRGGFRLEDLPETYNTAIDVLAQWLIKKSGIIGLSATTVWMGKGTTMLFWQLPYSTWKPPHQNPRSRPRLTRFLPRAFFQRGLRSWHPLKEARLTCCDGLSGYPFTIEKIRMECSPFYRTISVSLRHLYFSKLQYHD